MLLKDGKFLGPGVKSPNVSCTFDDQIDAHRRVDDVVVDNEVVRILDERPIHVCCPIDQQQRHTERRTHANHQPEQKRKSYEQVPVAHQEGQDGVDGRRCEHGIDVMEGLGLAEERRGAELRVEYLM